MIFLFFYLPRDKYSHWSTWWQPLWVRECTLQGTQEDRSTINFGRVRVWTPATFVAGECYIHYAMPLRLVQAHLDQMARHQENACFCTSSLRSSGISPKLGSSSWPMPARAKQWRNFDPKTQEPGKKKEQKNKKSKVSVSAAKQELFYQDQGPI